MMATTEIVIGVGACACAAYLLGYRRGWAAMALATVESARAVKRASDALPTMKVVMLNKGESPDEPPKAA